MVELFLEESRRFVNPQQPHTAAIPGDTAAPSLSLRQRQVLECLLHGDSANQVARRLSLSVHTVNDYVKSLYSRFNLQSRGELLARFAGRS